MTSGERDDRGPGLEPPGKTLDVAPTRLRGSGGGRGRGAVALASIAVVIGTAVALAQLAAPPSITRQVAPSAPIAARNAAPPSATATAIAAGPIRLRPSDLAIAVRDGTLDGRLVFVDGSMVSTPTGCRNLAEVRTGCIALAVPGLSVSIWAAATARPWPGDPPAGAWLVAVVRPGGLAYLGSLLPDRDRVAGITALEAKLAAKETIPAAGTLYEVDGSLVPLPRRSCTDGCPAASPFLVDKLATVGELLSSSGIPVVVDTGTPEVDRNAVVVQGTFLVGRVQGGPGWRIVARYLPGQSVRVLAP